MPYADMELLSVTDYISNQYSSVLNIEFITLNSIPAIAYSFDPVDEENICGVYGVALFYNNMLLRFEVSSVEPDDDVVVSSETGISLAKARFDELLPTLTIIKR